MLSTISETLKPSVSVIVTGKNVANTIERCLNSITSQQLRPKEIIYVDGGSSDASPRIARKFASIVVEGSTSNPARGRNVGIGYAVGDILVFVDADCEISNSWISDAAKILLSDDKIGVVGGAYLPDDLAPGSARDLQFALASPLISLGSIQHRPKKRQSKVSSIPAGVLAVRKKIINEIGAFDPDLAYCEDSELCERIRGSGYVVLFAPSLLAKHMKTYSLRGLTDLGYRYGRGRALALGKHPRLFTIRNIVPVVLLIMGILALSRPIDPTLASNASLTLGVYCLGVIGASVFVSYRQSRLESTLRVVLAHFAVHFSYGLGFVWGIARLARRRILVLFPIIIGILFVAFQQLSALNASGMIIGWDTAHYVYLARYVGDNGILAFLQAQRNSYILYPLLLRLASVFSGQPPLVVEEYLPIAVTAALFGSMFIYGLRVLRDNLAYATLPLFLVLWVALYRIGADLHSNLLGLSFALIGLAFSMEYLTSGHKFRLVPVVMALAGLSHPQTTAFAFGVLTVTLVTSKLVFPRTVFCRRRVVTLLAASLGPIVLALASDPTILEAGVRGVSYSVPWPPDIYSTFGFFLIPLFVIGAVQLVTLRARRSPQALLLMIWLAISLLVVSSGFALPGVRDWASRSLILIPTPVFLSNGTIVAIRGVWKLSQKIGSISLSKMFGAIGTLGLILLVSSGTFLSALQVQDYAGTHMRSFISNDARVALQELSHTRVLRPDPIFVVYMDDYWTGGFAQLWDNWIGIYVGNHHVYPGRLFYFFQGIQTPFNSSASKNISDLYFSTLTSSDLLGAQVIANHDVVILTPFYSALSAPEMKILVPISSEAYLVPRNATQQSLLNVPLTLSGFYNTAATEGHWYGIAKPWATNDLVLELYQPNSSSYTSTYSVSYQLFVPRSREYNVSLGAFDYEARYQAWSFCVGQLCRSIQYSGSRLPAAYSMRTTLLSGFNQVRITSTGKGPFIMNIDYVSISET